MKTGRYKCFGGDEWNPNDITIEAKETEKSYILKMVEDRTRYPSAHMEMLFSKSEKIVIPKINRKPGGHPIRDYNTWFVIYPFQAGIPFLFELESTQDEVKKTKGGQ